MKTAKKTNKKSKNKKTKRIILIAVIVLVILLACGGFGLYVADFYHAEDTVQVNVTEKNYQTVTLEEENIALVPENATEGIIFYPGGKVEYTAYLPLLRRFAERGILCVLIKMPCNLAILNPDGADGIAELFPQITSWYMAGHSLGGVMAASYTAEHADSVKGLLLLASYSTEKIPEGIAVLSLYGSEDKILNLEKYEEGKENLPSDAEEIIIEGGCHSYFGSYGMQKGDGEPTVSREEQMTQTVDLFISRLLLR